MEALLACSFSPPCNLPFFHHRVHHSLSMQPSLFCQGTPLSPLTIWYSGQSALFLFPLARAALAFLPTALFVAPRPLFPSQQVQYAQVFPLKPAPFSTVFAGPGSTNKSATSLLFSYYLTLALSSPPYPLLNHFSYLNLSGRNCLLSPPVLSGYNGFPDIRFSRRTKRLMSWPDGESYS